MAYPVNASIDPQHFYDVDVIKKRIAKLETTNLTRASMVDEAHIADAKIAIFIASILAAVAGYIVLPKALPRAEAKKP